MPPASTLPHSSEAGGSFLAAPDSLVVASYGGGLNSTAMLIEWVNRGYRLNLILFADTGGERPETYAQVAKMSRWLQDRGYPPVITVQYTDKTGAVVTLEDRCLQTNRLPSLAYGFKKCSQRFKRGPQDKYVNNWAPARVEWGAGRKITKLLGYDADEPHRAERAQRRYQMDLASDKPSLDVRKYVYQYPLIAWDMGRDECHEIALAAGFERVPKSACFFCPSTSNAEIYRLQDSHPDLLARALAIEANAESTTAGRGLGGQTRRWADIIAQPRMFREILPPISCECYDGD